MPHRDDFDDDLMDPSSEAYDYKPVSSDDSGGGKAIKILLAVTVIAGLGGAAWYFVGSPQSNSDNIPVVRADTSAMKERPSDPGGMDVPNRDKTVYNRVSGENTEPKLERLLPRPEQPLEKPTSSSGLALPELNQTVSSKTGMPALTKELPPVLESKTVEQPAPASVSEQPTKTEALPEVPPAEMAKNIVAPPPAPVGDPNAPRALVKRDEQPVAVDKEDKDALAAKIAEALNETPATEKTTAISSVESKPTPTAKPTTADSGYLLQLLSSKNEAGVKATWEKIKKDNGDIVNAFPADIVKADLGPDKGIYYRLRLGPVATGDEAKSVCAKLKQRKVGCFIVRVR